MKTLSELRDEKELTQKELAEQLEFDCSPSTIAMYETGERTPPLEKAKIIAIFFGVSVESIIFGSRTHISRANSPKYKAV